MEDRLKRGAAAFEAQLRERGNPYRDKLEAAGIEYPDHWDEMGSSEKDLWEEEQVAKLDDDSASSLRLIAPIDYQTGQPLLLTNMSPVAERLDNEQYLKNAIRYWSTAFRPEHNPLLEWPDEYPLEKLEEILQEYGFEEDEAGYFPDEDELREEISSLLEEFIEHEAETNKGTLLEPFGEHYEMERTLRPFLKRVAKDTLTKSVNKAYTVNKEGRATVDNEAYLKEVKASGILEELFS